MTRRKREGSIRTMLLLVTLGLSVFIAACSRSNDAKGGAAGVSRVTIPRLADPETFRREYLAFDTKITQCMRKEGFASYDFLIESSAFEANIPAMIDDDAFKRRSGYGATSNYLLSSDIQQRAPLTPLSQSQTAAYAKTYQHCIETYSSKFPSIKAAQSVSEQVNPAELAPQVEADDRMIPLRKKWRECMRTAGFKVENPWVSASKFSSDAADLISGGDYGDPKSKESQSVAKKLRDLRSNEMRMAAKDADCSESIASERDVIWAEYLSSGRKGKVDE
jgi:hypothetical protein